MVRPESWISPAGASPARVIAGELGSRPRFVVERRRAERGAESHIGGRAARAGEPPRAPGKGPDFGHVGDGGKREGMPGTAPANYLDGHQPVAKVRRLQNRLWAAAKQSSSRRFHALYDRIHRDDVLWEAW